jgi:hypothetical protein
LKFLKKIPETQNNAEAARKNIWTIRLFFLDLKMKEVAILRCPSLLRPSIEETGHG